MPPKAMGLLFISDNDVYNSLKRYTLRFAELLSVYDFNSILKTTGVINASATGCTRLKAKTLSK